MSTWHVWGDFIHTIPERIGEATRVTAHEHAAKKTAEAQGFDFDRRLRNGFEPWAAAFVSESDDGLEFQFASYPIVRGWQRVT